MMLAKSLLLPLVLLAVLHSFFFLSPVHATSDSCYDFITIFARGSGSAYDSEEFTALHNDIADRIDSKTIDYKVLDLDKNILAKNDLDYDAVTVTPGKPGGDINLEGALIHNENIGHYWQSEKSGVELLFKYLEQSPDIQNCPDTKLILSGYSQGAQVLGDALWDKRMEPFKDRIIFNAFFGDPKFMSHFGNTDPWLRGTLWPGSGGALRARDPYLPDDMVNKTGSWCDDGDHICNGDATKIPTSTHNQYAEQWIPQAAAEIAAKLQGYYAPLGHYVSPVCGTAKQDIVLAIDVSEAMRTASGFFTNPTIPTNLFASACNTRVAIVTFDAPGASQPKLAYDFTSSSLDLALELLSFAKLNDPLQHYAQQPTQVRQGIDLAMDVDWRKDAQKAVLAVTYGQPSRDDSDGLPSNDLLHDTLGKDIITKSREKGGIEIYEAFTIAERWMNNVDFGGGNFNFFVPFNQATGGDLLQGCGSYCSTDHIQWNMIGPLGLKPTVAVPKIKAKVGDTVDIKALNVSAGKALDPDFSARWYLNCDDPYDVQLGGTEMSHKFERTGSCLGSVVTTSNVRYCYYCGGVFARTVSQQSATIFPIDILPSDYKEPPKPGPITNLSKTRHATSLTASWKAPSNATQIGDLYYIIRDTHSDILAITKDTVLTIDGLDLGTTEPIFSIEAANSTGSGEQVESSSVKTVETASNTVSGATTVDGKSSVARPAIGINAQQPSVSDTTSERIISSIQTNNSPKTTASKTISTARQRTSNPNLWSILLIAVTVVAGMLLIWWTVIKRKKRY